MTLAAGLLFCSLLACFGSLFFHSLLLGITPMPSSLKAKRAILKLLPQKIEHGIIYELGSGWGGLAFLLAKQYPHSQVIAFELSPIPWFFSRVQQLFLNRPNLTIERKNFHHHNFSDAGAIVCYLFPSAMKKLSLKLKKELPSKSILISNTFSLIGWENETVLFLDDFAATRIYKYHNKNPSDVIK